METSLLQHSLLVLGGFIAWNMWEAYERKFDPPIFGTTTSGGPGILKFLDLLLFIGLVWIEFKNLTWWGAILHFGVFFFLAPFFFLDSFLSLFNWKQFAILAVVTKITFVIVYIVYLIMA